MIDGIQERLPRMSLQLRGFSGVPINFTDDIDPSPGTNLCGGYIARLQWIPTSFPKAVYQL